MSNIYLDGNTDILSAIRAEKIHVKHQIAESEAQIKRYAKNTKKSLSPIHYFKNLFTQDGLASLFYDSDWKGFFSKGMLISQGIKWGMNISKAVAKKVKEWRG